MKILFLSVITLIIFCVAGFSSLPAANAQLYGFPPVFSPFALWGNIQAPAAPTYLYNWGVPNYLGASSSRLLPSATMAGSLSPAAPLRAANAYINGATTVFVPPSATNLTVAIKQQGVQGVQPIKLSALTPPITVYIYPSGYVPPTTTTAPAAISGLGGLMPIFPSPSQPAFPFGQTSIAPWAVPAPSFIFPFI